MNLDANDWKSVVEATPPDAQPVLLYNMEWISDYEPDGIVQGFWEEFTKVYIGAFWNNYQDTWGAVECKPTHWMYLPPAPKMLYTQVINVIPLYDVIERINYFLGEVDEEENG